MTCVFCDLHWWQLHGGGRCSCEEELFFPLSLLEDLLDEDFGDLDEEDDGEEDAEDEEAEEEAEEEEEEEGLGGL